MLQLNYESSPVIPSCGPYMVALHQWIASLDLKDMYFNVPICPSHHNVPIDPVYSPCRYKLYATRWHVVNLHNGN